MYNAKKVLRSVVSDMFCRDFNMLEDKFDVHLMKFTSHFSISTFTVDQNTETDLEA